MGTFSPVSPTVHRRVVSVSDIMPPSPATAAAAANTPGTPFTTNMYANNNNNIAIHPSASSANSTTTITGPAPQQQQQHHHQQHHHHLSSSTTAATAPTANQPHGFVTSATPNLPAAQRTAADTQAALPAVLPPPHLNPASSVTAAVAAMSLAPSLSSIPAIPTLAQDPPAAPTTSSTASTSASPATNHTSNSCNNSNNNNVPAAAPPIFMPKPRRFIAFAFDEAMATYCPSAPSCPVEVPPRRTASLPATRLSNVPYPRAANPMVNDRRFRLAVADSLNANRKPAAP